MNLYYFLCKKLRYLNDTVYKQLSANVSHLTDTEK